MANSKQGMDTQQGMEDPLWGVFSTYAGWNQQIDGRELQKCLTDSGINGSYQPFSLETCRVMIAMMDRDYSGSIGFCEFKDLLTKLKRWKKTFLEFDADRSGTIEPNELHQATKVFGYDLTPQSLNLLVLRYSTDGRIPFDDFVACMVRLVSLTRCFDSRDATKRYTNPPFHWAIFLYDDFIQCAMSL